MVGHGEKHNICGHVCRRDLHFGDIRICSRKAAGVATRFSVRGGSDWVVAAGCDCGAYSGFDITQIRQRIEYDSEDRSIVITLLINIAIGVVVFSILVISMNGFSAESGQAGLITYIVLAVVVTIAMSLSAFLLTGYLIKREFSGAVAALIAVPVFSVFGAVLKVVCMLIGVGIAEFVGVNF